jgi:curved DNA-binding protein CbpA
LGDEPKIPKIVGDPSAMRELRLSAAEGFVLSRIDGRSNEKQLSAATGLSESMVRAALEKLESLKVIVFLSRPPPKVTTPSNPGSPPVSGERVAQTPGQTKEDAPAQETPNLAKRVLAAMPQVPANAPELSEDADLSRELRLRILATEAVLDSLDHYEFLSIERDTDKKGVKRAYFELASLYHPDRYFRKKLGSFKPRMEVLFGRATQALDTLSNKELRAEYDAYLIDLDRTRAIDDVMREAAAEAQRAEEDALRAAGRASLPEITVEPGGASVTVTVPPAAAVVQRNPSGFYPAPRTPPPGPPPPSVRPSQRVPGAPGSPAVSDQARRDALAMRLLGNRTLSSRAMPAAGAPSSPLPSRSADGGDALRRRYEDRVQQARRSQGEKYLGLARESEAKKDILGAATAYRVAVNFLAEGDPNLETARAVIAQADATLSDTYLRQAQYEDRSENWADAARSWQRVVRGRPKDPRAHERAANAMARSKGDLHLAAQYAQKAVALEPDNSDFKITLASVFIEAGLMLNARRELEAAAQLSPRNANIQALLKRVHKAG